MTLGFLLFGLTASVLFSDWLVGRLLWVLRWTGLLPWPNVEFGGLLDELYAACPREEGEHSEEVSMPAVWNEVATFRQAA